jgi:uncharacterized protein (TIGR00303 family)
VANLKRVNDIILAHEESKGEDFVGRIAGKRPLFIHVIGSTETAKIPGLSAAGKYPELTDYTPAADAELLLLSSCKVIQGVPTTPEGIPTPALITMSALRLADIPMLIVNGGVKVKPHAPFFELGGKAGEDIRSGRAVSNVGEVLKRAWVVGESLSKLADYLVIGESIPGGTTTALAVMLAMGVDARGKVSSSMPENPHELKIKVAEEGLKNSGIEFGSLADDPVTAISHVGDPMMPAFAGLVLGAARRCPVLIAGGTQMGAVLSIIKALDQTALQNIAIGTTRWLISDRSADLKGLIAQIADIPIIAADLNFSQSRFTGLRMYEKGFVKEGVGCGGAAIAAIARSESLISKTALLGEVERNYERLVLKGEMNV